MLINKMRGRYFELMLSLLIICGSITILSDLALHASLVNIYVRIISLCTNFAASLSVMAEINIYYTKYVYIIMKIYTSIRLKYKICTYFLNFIDIRYI